MLPGGNPLNWLEFLEEHGARAVEQSAKTSSERDEVLILKIPVEFQPSHIPDGSEAFVVTVSKPPQEPKMTDEEYEKQVAAQEEEKATRLAAALKKDPGFNYKIMSQLLYDYGDAEDFGADEFDPSTWTGDSYMDDWKFFTDDLSDWGFAIKDEPFDDESVCFFFSPIGDWISDREYSWEFITKLVQPHFTEEIGCAMESCFEVENMTEAEVVAKLKSLGIKEMPREE